MTNFRPAARVSARVATRVVLAFAAALLLGCGAAPVRVDWAPDVGPLAGFEPGAFPGAEGILHGFAAPDAADAADAGVLRVGDAVLYGLEVRDGERIDRRLLLFEVATLPIWFDIDADQLHFQEQRQQRTVVMTWTRDGAEETREYRIRPVVVRVRQFDADGGERSASHAELYEEPLRAGLWPLSHDEDAALAAAGADPVDDRMMAVLLLTTLQRLGSGDPTLKDLLFAVVETPSILSVLLHFGVTIGLESGSGTTAPPMPGLPGGDHVRVLPLALKVNGSPALQADVAVTRAPPPLSLGGGVLGAIARHPSDPSRLALLRVLATRRGDPPPPPRTVRFTRRS